MLSKQEHHRIGVERRSLSACPAALLMAVLVLASVSAAQADTGCADSATFTIDNRACPPCDTNCDGSVNQFDVANFVAAVAKTLPAPCSDCVGDTNGDGSVNQFDIQGFTECMGG